MKRGVKDPALGENLNKYWNRTEVENLPPKAIVTRTDGHIFKVVDKPTGIQLLPPSYDPETMEKK
jgi:hypothetical protein